MKVESKHSYKRKNLVMDDHMKAILCHNGSMFLDMSCPEMADLSEVL